MSLEEIVKSLAINTTISTEDESEHLGDEEEHSKLEKTKLYTNKKKLKGNERTKVGENVSAILQRKLLPKCKGTGMFAILHIIRNIGIEKAMCDLVASINVMPLSIYSSLNIGILKETGRPFLRSSRTKSDVNDGTLTTEFDGEIIKFNIYDTTKNPSNMSCVFAIDVANSFTQKTVHSNNHAYDNSRTCKDKTNAFQDHME
ncbi:hypothetical protein CDL12_19516 [Handroanthus impetiginosus]|uniref:Uncharacterized protein n=1 Tax=Handroanthus impetiginosus TaxID=429701 RepID=A0A2G9GRJ1_9LAMI|nr:hypothetical protein CDL12_19516 [Handroanthus impetiginosus]